MAINWGPLAFFLLVLALFLFYLARRTRAATGLPRGRVIYADTGRWEQLAQPLVSRRLGLIGRPDYLVADGLDVLPAEVKSHAAPAQPYPSHVMQLAAYCALVAETYGRRPSHGILRYANTTFEIPFTPALETRLSEILTAMRADLAAGDAPRDHDDPRRCRACAYRDLCPESLA